MINQLVFMRRIKVIDNYHTLASDVNFKYILDYIPKTTLLRIEGWMCINGHLQNKSYSTIKDNKGGCGQCRIKTLINYQNIAKTHNGEYIKDMIPKDVRTPIDGWKCINGHIWVATYDNVSQGKWCQKCYDIHRKKDISDYQILAKDHKLVYFLDHVPQRTEVLIWGWLCENSHTFSSSYQNIKKSVGCPECHKDTFKKLSDYQEIAYKYDGRYILDYIPQNSYTQINGWSCKNNHVWTATYNQISNGTWCKECITTNIEAYRQLAINNNGLYILDSIPESIYVPTNGWQCDKGHQWSARYRLIRYDKTWCPYCSKYKSERLAREIIESIMNLQFPTIRPDFLKYDKNRNLELDGYNEDYQIAFEYNGKQHYLYCPFFHSDITKFERLKDCDQFKVSTCLEENISLLIIPFIYNYTDPDKMFDYIFEQIIRLDWIIPELDCNS